MYIKIVELHIQKHFKHKKHGIYEKRMADKNPFQEQQDQVSFLLSSFNTRLRELEERNKIIKERTMLLGQNFLSLKEETISELREMKKQVSKMKEELNKLKETTQSLVSESNSFVRKGEMAVIERMLKDFQPLEFVRTKDFEEFKNKLKETK
jgi:hypothetical protein